MLSASFTADTLTSDFVSAWNAGANITPIANWTIEGSAQFSPTTSWVTYKLENVAIDTASTANVAVFIWCDDETTNAGDFLYITDVQLEKSAVATEFENRLISQEKTLCQWYLCNPLPGGSNCMGWRNGTQYVEGVVTFPVMRATPILSHALDANSWDGSGSPAGNDLSFYDIITPGYTTISGAGTLAAPYLNAVISNGSLYFYLLASGVLTFSGNAGDLGAFYFGPDVKILLSAEL